ncbi:FecR family protein [Mariniphaga anaerophila]|uniref:FecR family protein n=1 Tax=Mariniphaga anaerophila TaxID=1484053 RepID=A0A1M5EN06_9BACT|nr:FecR domain-containing protein [Mariniphaga anaerophila]SHF80524.1 FecR family protein [Mariniphaga anaerophila]
MNFDIIIKYLNGTSSSEEKQQFFAWIEENPENKNEFLELKKIWALTEKTDEDESTALALFHNSAKKHNNKSLLFKALKQAAIYILLIGIGGILSWFVLSSDKVSENEIYASNYTVTAPQGQMTNVELPDGTLVMLNSRSTISYDNDFSHGKREVTLNGEAFFDVQKDQEHPFIVKSPLLDIKVYGTSFNIEAYPEDNSISATLVDGSISVLNKDGLELTKLVPGEKARYTATDNKLIVSEVNTDMFVSWKKGLITFRNEKLEDIAKKIERWYNVEIVIRNKQLGKELYFGTILKNKPIDQILEVFKLTTSLKYEIVPRANEPTLIYWD